MANVWEPSVIKQVGALSFTAVSNWLLRLVLLLTRVGLRWQKHRSGSRGNYVESKQLEHTRGIYTSYYAGFEIIPQGVYLNIQLN